MGIREGLERGRTIGFQEARFMARFSGTEDDDESYDGGDYVDPRRSRFIASSEDMQLPEPPPRNASPPMLPPDVVPVPPPDDVDRVPDIRPRSYHNASPSVRHSQVSIPPDGYIPALDADHFIRIPPPHELSRPPPTPERMQSPLPQESEDRQQINGMPQSTTPHRAHKSRHQSSPGSNSTALSQFDMVNDPDYVTGRRSPLSVIHEALSAHTSPNPESIRGGHALRNQPSRVSSIIFPSGATKMFTFSH